MTQSNTPEPSTFHTKGCMAFAEETFWSANSRQVA